MFQFKNTTHHLIVQCKRAPVEKKLYVKTGSINFNIINLHSKVTSFSVQKPSDLLHLTQYFTKVQDIRPYSLNFVTKQAGMIISREDFSSDVRIAIANDLKPMFDDLDKIAITIKSDQRIILEKEDAIQLREFLIYQLPAIYGLPLYFASI